VAEFNFIFSSFKNICFFNTELQLMYKLMDRVPDGISSMLKDLEDHIITAGLDDMKQWAEVITQDSEKYVERLLELFRRFSKLVNLAFLDDPRFLTGRDKSYKMVVNDTSVFRLELPTSRQVLVV
jgi:cullin-5